MPGLEAIHLDEHGSGLEPDTAKFLCRAALGSVNTPSTSVTGSGPFDMRSSMH